MANNFALSDAENSTSRSLNREGIADLPPLKHHQQPTKIPGSQISEK